MQHTATRHTAMHRAASLIRGAAFASVLLAAGLVSAGVETAAAGSFSDCVAGLRTTAIRSGLSADIVNRALRLDEPDSRVQRLSTLQPEFKTPIWDYLAFLVDEERIRDGRAMLARHDATLRRAEKRFGVDRHILVALWGIESNFGRERGDSFVPHALATLICTGHRRQTFWRNELTTALKLVQRGDVRLDDLYGSWAGAFGHTQFIPSTYARLAIDFDGSGRRDLVNSIPDALGSTAHYLQRAGWQRDQSWMIEARVPPGYRGPSGRTRKAPLAVWARRGVTRADGAALSGSARAGLLMPAGRSGPAFLVFRNFDALYAYNHAESYAISISHLADRIAGYPGLRTAWPTPDPGLSRAERRRLQELLLAQGHAIGEADGRIGPLTRAAIEKAEERLGLPPTGRPGQRIYRALGGS